MDYQQLIIEALSDDAPCGENLEDDAQYQNFFFSALGTPEKYDGENTIPAEAPDWREIKTLALEYAERTKDLKLFAVLSQALLNTEGLHAFAECVAGIFHVIDEHWEGVYPPLDEDDKDPLERISALGALNEAFVTETLKALTILSVKGLGPINYQTLLNTQNQDDAQLSQTQLHELFRKNNSEDLQLFLNDLRYSHSSLVKINDCLIERAGHQYTVDFSKTLEVLEQMRAALEEYVVQPPEQEDEEEDGDSHVDSHAGNQDEEGDEPPRQANKQAIMNTKITSREDVIRCLELVNAYYVKYEPSSPIPVLINRTVQLVDKDFLEIIKDIYPDALPALHQLGGLKDSDEEEDGNSSDSDW